MHARAPQHLKNQQMAQTPIGARQHIPTALRMRTFRNPGIDRRVSIFRATWNWRSDCLFIVCGPACAAVRTASRIDFILRCAIVIAVRQAFYGHSVGAPASGWRVRCIGRGSYGANG
jgi:hypothetical protein